ncbi:MAG: serine hydrolase [Gammaproteobacteria bacterium]|jgi:D-alanyl-D-alanine carboxypeptidase|nr:serine hydrolase [Gammaproteobacteria bacterium]
MIKIKLFFIKATVISFLAFSLGIPAAAAQEDSISDDPDVQGQIRLFSAWLESQITYRGLPGIAVGVVYDQELIWSQGFGLANIATNQAMTTDTKFRMASHSKLLTATAIMQLREQGLVRLDDPVSEYLNWFQLQAADHEDPPITIEQLLSHRSGLPREAGAHWSDFEFPTQEQLMDLFPERQASFSPEVRWKYSNLAYSLAGMVIEKVSGESWADYIQGNIFAPLGMTASSVDLDVPGLATGYSRRMPDGSRSIIPFIDARGMAAATGLTSTVGDMAKFVSAQFRQGPRGGEQILSTPSLREMHRVRMLENDWSRGNGIGFGVYRLDDTVYVGHSGGYPGYTTNTMIQLDSKIGVIVLTNTNDSNPVDISRQLMSTVGQAVAELTDEDSELIPWDPSWERFTGLYRGVFSDNQVVLLNEQLVVISPNARNIDDSTSLEPLGNDLFLLNAPTGGGRIGEVVRFVEEDGQVLRMFTGDTYLDRVIE